MQKLITALLFAFLFSTAAVPLFAQTENDSGFAEQSYNPQYPLRVSEQLTSVLIFPAPIAPEGVDRGSAGIIAKTVDGVTNVLKIKATGSNIEPTNLTVITTDGKVYSFWVQYSKYADSRPIDLRKQHTEETEQAFFRNRQLNDEQVQALATQIATRKPFIRHPKAKSFKMKARLRGIYISSDVLFYRIAVSNKSHIDYATDFMRFYIQDKKRVKRTAEQEQELKPLFIYKEHGNITAGKTAQSIVVAFPRFTIADRKNFVVQLFEKGGDRNLELKINGRDITAARRLSSVTQ